ncbi:MAG: site-2 protease family protein [Myxococcota bacterium]|nr:site-2 protease family protein [Myxococcota bacterium]
MRSSPPDSNGLPPPSAMPSSDGATLPAVRRAAAPSKARVLAPPAWRKNAGLFLATVVSAFVTWMVHEPATRAGVMHGVEYTGALMAILLAHEFGHYIAARIHSVDASLPYFIPLPLLSPFGTMGAVIRMRSAITTRRALLDIGAAGPIAGLLLALPLYAWGVAHSQPVATDGSAGDTVQLGSSLLSMLLDHTFGPSVPEGMELMLSPVAFAGWVGMFVTMINLLPAGQLDGGHVGYALFGPLQNRVAQWVHRSMLAFFFVSLASFVARDLRAGMGLWHLGRHVNNSVFWLVWFEVLALLGSLASSSSSGRERSTDDQARLGARTRAFATLGLALLAGLLHERTSLALWGLWFAGLGVLLAMEARWGALRGSSLLLDHPPTEREPLRWKRVAVAIATLAFFALLFMPTPMAF